MEWLNDVLKIVSEGIQIPFDYLLDPRKRIFIPFLASSLVIAVLVYLMDKRGKTFRAYFFNKTHWFGQSTIVDYAFLFFNGLVKVILIAPFLLYSLRFAFYVNDYLIQYFGRVNLNLSRSEAVLYFTIASFIIKDFFSFLLHFLQHRVPFLWQFHKVHHSATTLTPLTQYRIHPIELLINNGRSLLLTGFLIGAFDYLSGQRVDAYTFMGVNVLGFVFRVTGANLRHSHIRLSYFKWLEYLLISPFQHQIHHSHEMAHHNRNLGAKLAIWDWMFGTLIHSQNVDELSFGLGEEDARFSSFWKNIISPFYGLFRIK